MIDEVINQLLAFSRPEWFLISISFFTSFLTIVAGTGGGVMLLAVMLSIFPPLIVLPIHGVVQLGSNFFRALLMRKFIAYEILIPFTVGAILGAGLGAQFVVTLDEGILQLILGLFILYLVWVPKLKNIRFLPPNIHFSVGGFLSTFASLFVGASGPLAAAFIARAAEKKEIYIATISSSMVVQHGFKTIVFGFAGFVFYDYILLIALMILTGFLGTYAGKHIVLRISQKLFSVVYKTVITLLALRLLWDAFKGFIPY